MNYIWFGIIVLLSLVELLTLDFVAFWFIFSAIIALIISLSVESFFIQFSYFVIIGIFSVLVVKPFIIHLFLKIRINKQGSDLINKSGIVTKTVNNKEGQIEINKIKWPVISDVKIKIGSKVKVIKIDDTKIIVEEQKNEKNKKKN